MNKKPSGKEALGKGIRSLLEHMDADLKKDAPASLHKEPVAAATAMERIPLDQIEINPQQPRRDFEARALEELARSIRIHDVIQPITVTRLSTKKFRLISGERRLRAAKAAKLADIPAYIRQTDDDGALLELALLENLQREDLNAIEIALSMKRLMEDCSLTQEALAERMSKDRSTVANFLRLLKLPPDIQAAVRGGSITMGHARALISVETVDRQLFIYHQIIGQQLSVRQTEALVRKVSATDRNHPAPKKATLPPAYRKIEDRLSSHFSTKVTLNRRSTGKGNIVIEFYSDEELNQILGSLER